MKKYVVEGKFFKAFNTDTYDSLELAVDMSNPYSIATVNLNELFHTNIKDGATVRVTIEVDEI